jgi:tripartite-type tricarboxylate transporter receptor subunit TctC
MKQNRRFALAALAAVCIATVAGEAAAQAWPTKPITIVVSYPAGGDTDAIARAYAEKLSARLGQQVIIANSTEFSTEHVLVDHRHPGPASEQAQASN